MTQSGRRLLVAYNGLIDTIRLQRLETQYSEQAKRLRDLQIASQQEDSALNSVRTTLHKNGVEIRGVDLVQDLAAA